ncbi:MAG: RAD55 family ATPase [Nitrososphaeria archaeon]
MNLHRDVLDILNTPGYVSIIEGRPGAGKTTLALAACAKRKSGVYITYSEPESSIRKKLEAVAPGSEVKVISMLSGVPERAFSAIETSLQTGSTVVLDTVDAMLLGINSGEPLRPFLQLIYASAKSRDSSLVIISEGTSQAAGQLAFIGDALISVEVKQVLGYPARSIRVLKDRDYSIQYPVQFFTLENGLRILEPVDFNVYHEIRKVNYIRRSASAEPSNVIKLGSTVLTEIDEEVSYVAARQYIMFTIFDYLQKGYSVNYLVPPEESDDQILRDSSVIGDRARNLRIIHPDAAAAGYDPDTFIRQIGSMMYQENAVDVVNLLSEEDFAVLKPLNFELFLRKILAMNTKRGALAHAYGYTDLSSTRIEKKYVKLLRKMTVAEGLILARSIKPPGPLRHIRIDPERGEMEFVRMV